MTRFNDAHQTLFNLATGQATTTLTDRDGSVVLDRDGQPIEIVDHSACLQAALFWLNANQHLSRGRGVNMNSAYSIKQHTERAKVYEYVMSLAEGNAKKVLQLNDGTVLRDRHGHPVFVIDHKVCGTAAIWWMKNHHGWGDPEAAAAKALATKNDPTPNGTAHIDALTLGEIISEIIAKGTASFIAERPYSTYLVDGHHRLRKL